LSNFVMLCTALQSFVGPCRLFSFLIYIQSVRLLGRGIRPSRGSHLHTGQHKHRINSHRHPFLEWYSNPRSQRLSQRRRSCLRPRGYCDRHFLILQPPKITHKFTRPPHLIFCRSAKYRESCILLQVPTRLYDVSMNLNSFTVSFHLQ
jgi:hypothetical protein